MALSVSHHDYDIGWMLCMPLFAVDTLGIWVNACRCCTEGKRVPVDFEHLAGKARSKFPGFQSFEVSQWNSTEVFPRLQGSKVSKVARLHGFYLYNLKLKSCREGSKVWGFLQSPGFKVTGLTCFLFPNFHFGKSKYKDLQSSSRLRGGFQLQIPAAQGSVASEPTVTSKMFQDVPRFQDVSRCVMHLQSFLWFWFVRLTRLWVQESRASKCQSSNVSSSRSQTSKVATTGATVNSESGVSLRC